MKKFTGLIIGVLVILTAASCAPETRVQTEQDQDFVRTQIAQTVMAQFAATETPVPEPTPEPTKQPGTRDNPVPMGQPLELVSGNDTYFKITVLEVERGDQVWQMFQQENWLNDPPAEGQEYINVKVRVEYISSKTPDMTLSINSFNFGTTSNNQIFDVPLVVSPMPALSVELFPGGIGEGYIEGVVFKDDQSPFFFYKEFLGDNRFFFSLQ